METKLSWRLWAFSLALILTVLVALSFLLDVSTIGATGRFAWNAVMAAVLVSARGLDTIAAFVLRRRIRRLASFFTTVGLGYSGNVILTHAQLQRAKGWRGTFRKHVTRLRNSWRALGTPWKCLLVALMIAMQVVLLPVISEYVLLIPIGFMIPLVANGARRFYAWMAESIFAASYRRYLGSTHRAALRSLRALAPLHGVRGAVRLLRMRYLAAWRLWKYDPRYRDPSGELWVSFFEPIRLWRERKLDRYIGRPLFARRRAACRSRESVIAKSRGSAA
jgi:hypothetical protein